MKESLRAYFRGWVDHPHLGRRIAIAVVSTVMMGLCVLAFERLDVGTDPFSCACIGLANLLGVDLGHVEAVVHTVTLLIVLAVARDMFGFGSLANMFLVGYSADLFSFLMDVLGLHPEALETAGKIAVFIPAIALVLVAAAFYMVVDLGTAPYDSMPLLIHDTFKKPSFMVTRMLWDVSFILLGLLVGADVGIVTVAIAFGLGPVIRAVADRFRPMIIPGDEGT